MPDLIDFKRSAALAFLTLPLGLRAELRYRKLPCLPAGCVDGVLPSLSIIIPARNEACTLPYLLTSLNGLEYPGKYEIIVVDDHSTDQTAAVASAYKAGVMRLEGGVPAGWLGKPYACHRGALSAKGEWLLFTDADTIHTRDGIARAVSYAVRNKLDGLSLFIHQEARSMGDQLALSVAHAGLFAGQLSSNHMLNGQFILINGQVYLESGGFEAVHDEPLEDVALGNRLHSQNYRLQVLNGEDAAVVRMYQDGRQMFLGMSRLASASLRWERSGAVLTVLLITGLMSPLIVLMGILRCKLNWRWLPITWGAASLSVFPWFRRFGGAAWSLLAPIGALVVLIAGVYGLISRLTGRGVLWKGRWV